MARIRTIKPKFYDDVKIGRLSREARYLYIALWVFADDMGVANGDTIWLKSKIYPYDQIQLQQFEKWMNELVTNGFICLLSYNGERFIYLPKFTRHQVINRPNYEDLNIPKELIDREKERITDLSLNNHGTITDLSLNNHGLYKEEEEEYIPPIVPLGDDRHSEERIDYNALMSTFNSMFEGKLPRATSMTEKRRKAVRARIAEHGKQAVMTVFAHVLQSPFLLGNNDKNWSCDFDWIFRPNNFIKILEGNYDGNRNGKNGRDSQQRKFNSAVAISTRVQEAAAKKRAELQAEGVIE